MDVPIFRVDDSIQRLQEDKLKKLRAERDAAKVETALSHITAAAKDGSNLMPYIIEAAESYATLGVIADAMREVFGEYKG